MFQRRKQQQHEEEAVAVETAPVEHNVADELANEARDAFAKKKSSSHSLPPAMVKKLCALLDKHGEDFEVSHPE